MESQSELFDTPEPWQTQGRRLKAAGMATAAAAEAEEGDWNERADAAINDLAVAGVRFTAEDVRFLVGDPAHPNAMGSRLSTAARRGIIQRVDYTDASRASRHSSAMAVWVGR